MNLSEKDLATIKQFFINKPVLRVYLFGSFSRGEAIKESDVDLLVDLDYSSHIGLGFYTMKDDLEKLLHKNVDIVSSKGVSKYIYPFIDQDKQLIYERKNG